MRERGRIGEVGPPASGCSFFTVPYSHLAVLNGNPALRGRPATAETWNAREKGTAGPLP